MIALGKRLTFLLNLLEAHHLKLKAASVVIPLLALWPVYFIKDAYQDIWEITFGVLEKGAVEWIQFVCYTCAAVLGVITYITLKKKRRGSAVLSLLLFFVVGCVVVAGEEISWGQHIFQWSSPNIFLQNNHQKETNIHNFPIFGALFHYGIIIFGLAGGVCWLLKFTTLGRADFFSYAIPDWWCCTWFLVVGIVYSYFTFLKPASFSYLVPMQELYETYLSTGFLLVAISNYHKAKNT